MYLLLYQLSQILFSVFPRIFLSMLLIFIDGTAQSNAQSLDSVNRTYLVLASGKLAQKNYVSLKNAKIDSIIIFFRLDAGIFRRTFGNYQ